VIYSYNNTNEMNYFSNLFLIKELYVFRTDLLSIIRSFNTVHTAIGIYHASYVDSASEVRMDLMEFLNSFKAWLSQHEEPRLTWVSEFCPQKFYVFRMIITSKQSHLLMQRSPIGLSDGSKFFSVKYEFSHCI